jgi:hypothetical protein
MGGAVLSFRKCISRTQKFPHPPTPARNNHCCVFFLYQLLFSVLEFLRNGIPFFLKRGFWGLSSA